MSERPTPITDAARRYCMGRLHPKEWADYIAKVCADLERQLAEAREEIGRIRKFATVNGVVELERQLSESKAQLAIADEQLALERGALAEVLEILDAFEYEPDEDSCMGMSFFKARLCEDSFFHLKWKLEEALKSPANTRNHPPQVG